MGDPEARSSQTDELPFLSPSEWRVFSLLCRKGPLTVRQIVEELEASSDDSRSYTTLLTLAQRLTAKGYLAPGEKAASRGPTSAITYSPLVSYQEALRRHAERFLDQYAPSPDDLLIVRQVVAKHLVRP